CLREYRLGALWARREAGPAGNAHRASPHLFRPRSEARPGEARLSRGLRAARCQALGAAAVLYRDHRGFRRIPGSAFSLAGDAPGLSQRPAVRPRQLPQAPGGSAWPYFAATCPALVSAEPGSAVFRDGSMEARNFLMPAASMIM